MVDLKARPFYLSNEDNAWVEDTISGMTVEEKIGRFPVNMNRSTDPAYMQEALDKYHIGGIRCPNRSAAEPVRAEPLPPGAQQRSRSHRRQLRVGRERRNEGRHLVATSAMSGAARTDEVAYQAGYVGGREAEAIGCNWNSLRRSPIST